MKIKKYIVSAIVLALFILGFYAYFILGNQARSTRGIQKGREYAMKMYSDYQIVGENCQGEDSDSNGYVTCNFRLKQSSTSQEKMEIRKTLRFQ